MVLVAACALLVAGCSDSGPHRDGARTYYESLDLSSPTAAVETFADAFAGDDFMTVWFAFGWHAQSGLQQDMRLLQYGRIIGPDSLDDLRNWMQNEFSLETMESLDQWWFFDQIMLVADENDGFLIDLSGDVSIEREEIKDDTAVVFAKVSGISGEVEFRLKESASGRWQVDQVFIPGGDEDLFPWAVPNTSN